MSQRYDPRTDGLGPYGRPQGDPNYGQYLSRTDQAREMYERAIRAENRAKGQGDPNFAYESAPPLQPITGPIYDGGPFDPNTGPRQDLPSPGSPPLNEDGIYGGPNPYIFYSGLGAGGGTNRGLVDETPVGGGQITPEQKKAIKAQYSQYEALRGQAEQQRQASFANLQGAALGNAGTIAPFSQGAALGNAAYQTPIPQQQPQYDWVGPAMGAAASTAQGTRKKKAPKRGKKNIQPRNQVQSAILGGASRLFGR